MSWTIKFGYGDRDDRLDADALQLAGVGLEGDERRIAQEIVFNAFSDPRWPAIPSFPWRADRAATT